MGCVQAKLDFPSPSKGLDGLKLQNGYVKGGAERRPVDRKQQVKGDGGGGRAVNGKGERNGGSGSQRAGANKKIGGDELVNGWPKWLVDNIDRAALAGLVPKSADSYEKLAKVGQGTYSNVYKARDRDNGKIVALKKVRFDTSEPESVKFMAREITVLQHLDHPNVIKLEGIATSRMQYSLYLVFDFMQSDLTKIICRPGERLAEPQVKCYMQQLLAGLQHCHKKGILHRDIKASNLLIDKSGQLKIADFGLANFFNPDEKCPLTSRVVTLWYRAPELLLGSTDYGVGVDLWSAGCLLAEMFLGRAFMPGKTEVEQLHRIFKLCGAPSEDYWKKMKLQTSFRPPPHYQPSYRGTFKDFPASSFGLLCKLLALDPAYRGTASFALQDEFFKTSPLACDLSGLPVVQKEELQASHPKSLKKLRSSKAKDPSHTNSEVSNKKHVRIVDPKVETESSKEEKNAELSTQSVEVGNSISSTSSSLKPIMHGVNLHSSLSPIHRSIRKASSSQTEGHPNAVRNIQNYTLLQASITDIINPREGGDGMARVRRSLSTLDFRYRNAEEIAKFFGLEK
ncbi:hypothetical protein CDL15_Pgr017306 [Punica granatum]|uniref:Protein kinase domain-containing protein n=1 Tax=Punica granatum TaxID=22663 RepID=A0A218Y2V5_PUNGR|nr:hypothetical protein CDL15_Pgr017306 [Punica granatum]